MQTVLKDNKFTASGIAIWCQSFGYDYDDIGNLKTENRNGNVFKYTANNVNQYTQRTVPGRVNISGSADANAKVTIKQASAGYTKPLRYGNYFNAFFNLDNSTNAVTDSFDVYAVKYDGTKDIVAKQTLNVFVPKTPEQFTYDNDGNLLSDGKFTYTWDAENRLIKAEYSDTRIEFTYDYMGRRINKRLYVNNVLNSERRFVYDGWNLIAEFDGSNNLLNSYLWGEDLSGSLQGAGGVGGLLSTTSYTSSMSYMPIYDGNGNITTYLDNSGNTVATYEYDPFGKIICAFGSKADDMLYRFSTKYFDKETALYYYGYRYYNPETSRWLSRDPIGEKGGINRYSFVNNDLVNRVDFLGLEDFYVVGMALEEVGDDDTKSQRIQRFFGRLLNAEHMIVTYGNEGIREGGAGEISYTPKSSNILAKWKLTRVTDQKNELKWGSDKGTKCSCADDKMRISCIKSSTQIKANEYSALFNNCQQDIYRAIQGCCLKGYTPTGFYSGTSDMTQEEKEALKEKTERDFMVNEYLKYMTPGL